MYIELREDMYQPGLLTATEKVWRVG